MRYKKFFVFATILLSQPIISNAQKYYLPDSSEYSISKHSQVLHSNIRSNEKKYLINRLLLPAMLISYGVTSLHNHALKAINDEVKEEVFLEHFHRGLHIDNWLQFTPAAAVYGLNSSGIKSRHTLHDISIIYIMSNLFLITSVRGVKKWSHVLRPDGSAYTSFPSGHTAEAFAGAELLRLEYKDVSAWYGVGGYAAAIATGYLRMYNNKHWLNDVVAGAGVGMASTTFAWWLYPKIQKLRPYKKINTVLLPSYQNGCISLGMVRNF